ncbi:hypothetical protein C2845_PM16G18620 [Panicum miliaceum]|uniref:DUF674 family protein n=1 Tax=Panicum miliaceum TaxID=4540 RepID=A0A3L6PYU2_PANMI|nr:hypothetical protein C2845_PM16G18620 [Panicum miliaceum]
MSNNAETVAVKLFIDKEKQKVLFAESDKEFVDVLFSFLTLPLGSIVRLLGKQSGVGCLDEIVRTSVGYNRDGGFVKSGLKFIITDGLQVSPASTSIVFSLLDKFGLHEESNVEENILELNSNKIISLLKRALISQQALTGLFFDVAITPDALNLDHLSDNFLKQPKQAEHRFNAIKIKLIQTKDNDSVLYAEAGQDFIDLIFSLLSIPLGSVIMAYGQWSPNGCIDNLYRSIAGRGYIKEECQDLLLSPKLAPYFGCSINVLQVKELDARMLKVKCLFCLHRHHCLCKSPLATTLRETNPKSSSASDEYTTNGAYIKGGPRNFIVTNSLRILQFSLANTLQLLREAKIPKEKLVEKEIALDETQVLKLLRAAIFTGEALSSALLPRKKKRHPHHY